MANEELAPATQRAYEVMRFEEYCEKSNTVRFSSPYLHVLALKVLISGIKDGKSPHSFQIRSNIAKNHGRTDMEAFEIVCAIVRLIEQTDGIVARIRVKNLLECCPSLWKNYELTKSWNKHNVLDRAFGKAWKYLGEYTNLSEKYKEIQLPPADAKYVAKCRDLKFVIEIPHQGKIEA